MASRPTLSADAGVATFWFGTIVLLAQLLSTAPLFAATKDVAAPKDIPCFHRGVAIHNMMNWAAVEQSDPSRYVFPAFAGPNYETSDALLRNVAAAGFDFVRLTIDPGPFLQFTGMKREALDQHLRGVVERLLRNGFCVIVDFHPNSQVPKYALLKSLFRRSTIHCSLLMQAR